MIKSWLDDKWTKAIRSNTDEHIQKVIDHYMHNEDYSISWKILFVSWIGSDEHLHLECENTSVEG